MGAENGCEGEELRRQLEVWDEHFERRLGPEELPGMKVVTTRAPFTDYRCGCLHADTRKRIILIVHGECLYDDDTGEFLGGLCWCDDLQEFSEFVLEQQQRKLRSHETICDLMPHLVWTTAVEGKCDYFSERWYDYTGLTKEESLGHGYQKVIHPEDLPSVLRKFGEGMATGEDCEIEIRYRRKDGVFRWMLARACPYKDENGKILKWYGTHTDIHEKIMAQIEAKRNKH